MGIACTDSRRFGSLFDRAFYALALAAGNCLTLGVASAQSFTGVGFSIGGIETFA